MKITYLIIAAALISSIAVNGQPKRAASRIEKSHRFDPIQERPSEENGIGLIRQSSGAKKDDAFLLKNEKISKSGYHRKYYDQYYKGIKVEGSRYSVHSKGGKIEHIIGVYHDVGDVNTNPVLSESQAIQSAIRKIGAEKYMWEDSTEESLLKKIKGNADATYYPKGELVICNSNDEYRLAYKFNIYASKPLSRKYYYVDAVDGNIVLEYNLLGHANAVGTADTRYSGTRSITTESFSNGYRLRETRSGLSGNAYIETADTEGYYSESYNVDFEDNDNNWTAAEYDNIDKDNGALDAHWATEQFFDYFDQKHDRRSIDDNGHGLYNMVHTSLGANSSWDGGRVRYGDGNAQTDIMTTLDIVVHEFSHGMTQYTSTLVREGEPGALNEGFSDVWAAIVEDWAATQYSLSGKDPWLLGEELFDSDTAIRSLKNPSSITYSLEEGAVIGTYPDTYQGIGYYTGTDDDGGAHINSTVFSHWFYLLAVGGSGTNDNNDNYCVSGLGLEQAAELLYYAQTNLFTGSSFATFSLARDFTIIAAEQEYGINSSEAIQVANAWYAVGVGDSPFTISGPDILCSTNQPYTTDFPAGTSVSWSVSPTNLFAVDSYNGPVFTTRATNSNSRGAGTITATSDCGTVSFDVWVGRPDQIYSVLGSSSVVQNAWEFYQVSPPNGASDYTWVIPSGWSHHHTSDIDSDVVLLITGSQSGYVRARANNNCGSSLYRSKYVTVTGGGCSGPICFSVFPNPTTTEINIETTQNSTEASQVSNAQTSNMTSKTQSNNDFDIALYNADQQTVFQGKMKDNLKINTRRLKKGMYFLKVRSKNQIVHERTILIE